VKVSTDIDNNFGYEKITQLVDNIPLRIFIYFYVSSPDAAAWILKQVSIKVEEKSYLRTDCI
jgi:hypothetical protein